MAAAADFVEFDATMLRQAFDQVSSEIGRIRRNTT
jgi:hypothetical protein